MIGETFQPDQEEALRKRLNQPQPGPGQMSSEALRILSMRLPDVLSGRPIAPQDLLTPRMGGLGMNPAMAALGRMPTPAPPSPVSAPGAGVSPEVGQLLAVINSALNAPPPNIGTIQDLPPGKPKIEYQGIPGGTATGPVNPFQQGQDRRTPGGPGRGGPFGA